MTRDITPTPQPPHPHQLSAQDDPSLIDTVSLFTPATSSKPKLITYKGGYSEIGLRKANEDSFFLGSELSLWAVSDGIGGAPFGDVISRVACNLFADLWPQVDANKSVAERMRSTFAEVDRYVTRLSVLLGDLGSGATLVVAVYESDQVYIGQVGDSKSFLIRDGKLSQLTQEGRVSEGSNRLDQALGYGMDLNVSLTSFKPQVGDLLILCTDGVWSNIEDDQMCRIVLGKLRDAQQVAREGNPQPMAYRLVKATVAHDNATAVVILFDASPASE